MIINKNLPKSSYSKRKVLVRCNDCRIVFERRYDSKSFDLCINCSRKKTGLSRRGIARPEEVKIKMAIGKRLSAKPKVTITCAFCHKEFVVKYADRDRLYCSKSCASKVSRKSIKTKSVCVVCKKEFLHYGERVVCGRQCLAKYMSISRIGENNPAYKVEKEKKRCLYCKKEFEYTRSGMSKGSQRVFCSLACAHQIDLKGIAKSGVVNLYPFGWNKMRKIIRERDEYVCQLCGILENNEDHHHVHHIDYDKNNLDTNNLITLCRRCHNMTHHGRTFWEIVFSGMISGSKIVKKPWGAEVHIANNNDYCLKYLIFFKDRQFSYHFHDIKRELWHCLHGKLQCILEFNEKKECLMLEQGDKLQIEQDVVHQIQAIKNSILVEVSTKDFPEDSIRIINGVN